MGSIIETFGLNSTDTYNDYEETFIAYAAPNTNYYGSADFVAARRIGAYTDYTHELVRFNLFNNIPRVNITDARLRLYTTAKGTYTNTHYIYIYRVLQPWVKTEATWNKFTYSVNWNTAGCDAYNDGGVDDGVYDRLTTSTYYTLPLDPGYWMELDITSLANKWVNKEIKEYGCLVRAAGFTYDQGNIFVGGAGADGYRPHLQVEYDVNYYFSGTVLEQGNPAGGRKIAAYRRDTNDLIGTTTTSGSGEFYLETTYSGSHYVVCLDDTSGIIYNDLILGRVTPKLIT